MNLLQVEELKAGYGRKNIINAISIELSDGEIVGILGPNGCGKSTMIKALCKGIPYQGRVSLCGRDVREMSEKELARNCSYVPQRSGLSIDISVIEVLLMGFYPHMGLLERPDKKMKEKAKELLKRVGLENEKYSNYMELSEGQKRMCILARSLVADAKLLLMDEPDASLDFGVRNNLMDIISERALKNKTGVLISLHDINLALAYCKKIYLMKKGSIVDMIIPNEDLVSDMEMKLCELYGKVRLLEYLNEDGARKLIMVQA